MIVPISGLAQGNVLTTFIHNPVIASPVCELGPKSEEELYWGKFRDIYIFKLYLSYEAQFYSLKIHNVNLEYFFLIMRFLRNTFIASKTAAIVQECPFRLNPFCLNSRGFFFPCSIWSTRSHARKTHSPHQLREKSKLTPARKERGQSCG